MGAAKVFKPRSPRYKAYPDRFPGYVRYFESGELGQPRPAQFADVSVSGMKVISRHPTNAEVGDLLTLEFTLPGAAQSVERTAQVVRKIDEYVFAIRFIHPDSKTGIHDLQSAIEQYVEFVKKMFRLGPYIRLANWVREHRQGLLLSLIGMVLIGGIGVWIYMGSDEYHGRGLRAWGKSVPKEWFMGYYENLLKKSK